MKAVETKTTASNQHDQRTVDSDVPFFQRKEDRAGTGSDKLSFIGPSDRGPYPFFHRAAVSDVQAKLTVGRPGDSYEKEADQVADRVVRKMNSPGNIEPAGQTIQRESSLDREEQLQEKEQSAEEINEDIQLKPIFESNNDPPEDDTIQRKYPVQRKSVSSETQSPDLERNLRQSRGSGSPLPEETRITMEREFGADFSGVRVHTDASAASMSQELGAQAFTHGSDIYFNEGKYDTNSASGQHLLAHELTHTVQQGAVVRSKPISTTGGPRIQRFWGIGSLLNRIARHIPGYTLMTVILGRNPLTGDAVPRTAENFLGGFLALIPGGSILVDKLKETGALAEAGNWLASEVTKLNITWGYIRSLIDRIKESVSITDISGSIDRAKQILSEPWRRIRRLAGNLAGKIKEFIFKGALKLVGAPVNLIMGIIDKGKDVLMKIIADPIGFFRNMGAAVGKGIRQFVGNIKQHLVGGLVSWLTGAMGDLPIQIPERFDLKGVLHLALQILGLTYQRIRKRIVKFVGEKPVALAEQGFSLLKRVVTEGPIALWEMLKEKAGEIKQAVMDGIKNWVITRVVKSAIVQILSMLNPAGALVQAAMKIYQFIMFLYQNLSRIADFVRSIFNSIGEIARGAVGTAANFIEAAMAKAIPILLSFLARMVNLSGIGKAIKKVIEKIRKPIDKVVSKIVSFLAKKIRKLFGRGKDARGKPDDRKRYTQKDKVEGLKAIKQEEKSFIKKNAITYEDAQNVAFKVKHKHPVFKSITVIDGGGDWDYKYVYRAIQDGAKKAKGQKIPKCTVQPPFIIYANNPLEFKRQLKQQEDGLNEMKVKKWMANWKKFDRDGRQKDDLAKLRKRIRKDISEAFIRKNASRFRIQNINKDQVNRLANKYAKKILTKHHAILHNPDQVAGGEPMLGKLYNQGDITDETSLKASKLVGDKGVNSSLGSQWSHGRSRNLYKNVKSKYDRLSVDQRNDVVMNVKLPYK